MNLLRHPIYAATCLALCAWIPYGNMRGLSLLHSASPTRWLSSHGSSGISHK